MASIEKRDNGSGGPATATTAAKEHARHFERKVDAQRWLDEQTSKLITGTHVAPETALITVGEWCDTWLTGYRGHRASTVRQAEVHLARIRAAFGDMRLGAVRPSHVRTWCAQLGAEGLADSYVDALHARLSQIYADAVHDGLVAKSPCSPADLAQGGLSAGLRSQHRAGLGASRRHARASAAGGPARRLRGPAAC